MRKADYMLLAQIVESRIALLRSVDNDLQIMALADMMRKFAKGASVDAVLFLRQCGIHPDD